MCPPRSNSRELLSTGAKEGEHGALPYGRRRCGEAVEPAPESQAYSRGERTLVAKGVDMKRMLHASSEFTARFASFTHDSVDARGGHGVKVV